MTFSAKKYKKITIFQYRRYSILEVRYSILFDTVKSFEISGFDRYSIQYSQGCSQAECRRRKVRRLLGLAGFGLVMMMEMVVMWAHYTIPLKDICQKDFSACQDGQVRLTLLSHIQPSRKYHDCITMIKNTSFPSKLFSIWIFLTSSWHVRHHVPTSPAFQPLLMWQNAS